MARLGQTVDFIVMGTHGRTGLARQRRGRRTAARKAAGSRKVR